VDGTWLIHQLQAASHAQAATWPPRRTSIQKRLAAMRAQAAGALGAPAPDDVAPRLNSAAAEILKGREFQQPSHRWLEALQNRIAQAIQALLDQLGAGRLPRQQLAIVLAWIVAVAAFAGLGIWLVRSLGSATERVPLGLSRTQPRRISAREWALRAVSAARAGDFREAVRCGYTAAVKKLEEQGAWRIDDSRTPREYLQLLGRDDERRPPVQRLTEQFEEVWYGNRPVHQDDLRGVGSILEQLGCLHPADRAT
jgi:hypothetical protein